MKKVITIKVALYKVIETGDYFTSTVFTDDEEIYKKATQGSKFVKFVYLATEVNE